MLQPQLEYHDSCIKEIKQYHISIFIHPKFVGMKSKIGFLVVFLNVLCILFPYATSEINEINFLIRCNIQCIRCM